MREQKDKRRRLLKLWHWVRDGLGPQGRYHRYAVAIGGTSAIIWGIATLYVVTAPDVYRSKFSLILPGQGVGSSVMISELGQASSSAPSPFSSPSVSPTENYKRLLGADIVRGKAAERLGVNAGAFATPRVKLIDQTNFIQVSMDGGSGKAAQDQAHALLAAFQDELERLRDDEEAQREGNDQIQIRNLKEKVKDSQLRLIRYQADTALVSMDQYGEIVGALEALRQRKLSVEAQLKDRQALVRQLEADLNITAKDAAIALTLKSDQLFQGLLKEYTDILIAYEADAGRLGSKHPKLLKRAVDLNAIKTSMTARAKTSADIEEKQLWSIADLSVEAGRSNLFQRLLSTEAERAGLAAQAAHLNAQISAQEARAQDLADEASQLAELKRDHQVAETVFASAVARLDARKSDRFSSYPLVQLFEAPSLPAEPHSPNAMIAFGGAALATIFIIIGYLLAWVRQPIIARLLPND